MRMILIFLLLFFTLPVIYADTIVMNDGEEHKGLVVEEYVDRVIFNTVDGEKTVFRKDIRSIDYNSPEQNFMQLGRAYDSKGLDDKAVFYYKKAMELNPDYKEARAAYLASHAKMWRQEEQMVRKEMEHRSMVMNWQKNQILPSPKPNDKMFLLRGTLGFSFVENDNIFTINEVVPGSSSAKAGIKQGDMLVGVLGKFIMYSSLESIVDELLGPKYSEVSVKIEREVSIHIIGLEKNIYKGLGILLEFEYEGLMVKDVFPLGKGAGAGLNKGDLIISIDGNMTRYLPLDSIITLINTSDNENIVFTIRRPVNLRREGK